MVFIAAKTSPTEGDVPLLAEPPTLDPPYPDVAAVVRKHAQPLPKSALGKDGTWHLAGSTVTDKLRKMRGAGPTLKDFLSSRVYRGLTTGFNDASVIDAAKRQQLITADPGSREIIRPFAGGKDVEKWNLCSTGRWLIHTPIGIHIKKYPAVLQHLSRFETQLEKRDDQGEYWWELRPCTYYDEFLRPKIVSTKVSIQPTFALDTHKHFLGNTAYFVPAVKDALYVLGILNSSLSKFYAASVFVGKQNGWYEVQSAALEQMPIPEASSKDKAAIEKLDQKCLDAKGQNCEAWEKEIDERVAALYGL